MEIMAILPIIMLFILFFTGFPVAWALLISTLVYFVFADTGMPPDLVCQRLIVAAESFPLLAVPFFITAGSVMNYAGISKRLMEMAEVISGHIIGGFAQVNIVLSTFMGGVSGSANADAAMVSKVVVPQMVEQGMTKSFSAAVTATSATISPIIPPGIGLILYALLADVSVGKMFVAGYFPGVLMCLALMAIVGIIAQKRGYRATRDKMASFKEITKQLFYSSWALFLPFGIILGLRFGMFTPTEAGAMCVLYSTIVGMFVYRKLKIHHFKAILLESVLGTSSIMIIICAANAFGYYLSWERIPHDLSNAVVAHIHSPILFLITINLLLLFLGMFLEGVATLVILVPLLIIPAEHLGIDLIHFGIIMVLNLTIGAVTPPFGILFFTTSSILEMRPFEIMREALPFIIALILCLAIVTFTPKIVLFLPELIYWE